MFVLLSGRRYHACAVLGLCDMESLVISSNSGCFTCIAVEVALRSKLHVNDPIWAGRTPELTNIAFNRFETDPADILTGTSLPGSLLVQGSNMYGSVSWLLDLGRRAFGRATSMNVLTHVTAKGSILR